MPLSGTITRLPKRRLIEVVAEIASPDESTLAMCDVPGLPSTNQHLGIEAMGRRWRFW